MISLNSISSPLTHTVVRTEFTYPKTGLTPEQLKKALIALATPDKLEDAQLPAGTPNLIIFNNATDEAGRSWIIDELFPTL